MVLVPILCVLGYDLLAGRWDDSSSAGRSDESSRPTTGAAFVRCASSTASRSSSSLPTCGGCDRWSAGTRTARRAHQIGNRLAYDRVLMQACDMLEIEHELAGESIGFERDIERIRIEAELERAGIMVTDRRFGQAA